MTDNTFFDDENNEEMEDSVPLLSQRINAEWLATSALREVLGIARKRTPTYSETLAIGSQIAPQLFSADSLLLGANESLLIRLYRQKANVLSMQRGTEITPLEAIDEDIEEYKDLLSIPVSDTSLLWRQLNTLERARASLVEGRYTESQIILRDVIDVKQDMPITGSGRGYRDYLISDERGLRIRLLHPDPSEHALGADVIYETHWSDEKLIRIVLIQYKLWNGRRLYLSQSGNLLDQLEKLENQICTRGICLISSEDPRSDRYRLPFCAAFLRPTDALQSADHRLQSSAYHTPICVVKRSWSETSRGGKMLESHIIRSESVTHRVFEELFNIGMLGSRWLQYSEVESLYRETGIIQTTDNIQIHAQEYGIANK